LSSPIDLLQKRSVVGRTASSGTRSWVRRSIEMTGVPRAALQAFLLEVSGLTPSRDRLLPNLIHPMHLASWFALSSRAETMQQHTVWSKRPPHLGTPKPIGLSEPSFCFDELVLGHPCSLYNDVPCQQISVRWSGFL